MAKENEAKRPITVSFYLDHEPAVRELEWIIASYNLAVKKRGQDSPIAEFHRGQVRGALQMIALIAAGTNFKREVIRLAEEKLGNLPSTLPPSDD